MKVTDTKLTMEKLLYLRVSKGPVRTLSTSFFPKMLPNQPAIRQKSYRRQRVTVGFTTNGPQMTCDMGPILDKHYKVFSDACILYH